MFKLINPTTLLEPLSALLPDTPRQARVKSGLLHEPTCKDAPLLDEEGLCRFCMNVHTSVSRDRIAPIRDAIDNNINAWLKILENPNRNNVHLQQWAGERYKANTILSEIADEMLTEFIEIRKQGCRRNFTADVVQTGMRHEALDDKVSEETAWRWCCSFYAASKAILQYNIRIWVKICENPICTIASYQHWAKERHKANTILLEKLETQVAEEVALRRPKEEPLTEAVKVASHVEYEVLLDDVAKEVAWREDGVRTYATRGKDVAGLDSCAWKHGKDDPFSSAQELRKSIIPHGPRILPQAPIEVSNGFLPQGLRKRMISQAPIEVSNAFQACVEPKKRL